MLSECVNGIHIVINIHVHNAICFQMTHLHTEPVKPVCEDCEADLLPQDQAVSHITDKKEKIRKERKQERKKVNKQERNC